MFDGIDSLLSSASDERGPPLYAREDAWLMARRTEMMASQECSWVMDGRVVIIFGSAGAY